MGVIRWREQYPGRWYGYLGKHGIADVIDFGYAVVCTLPDTLRNTDTEEFPGGTTAVSVEAAKTAVEAFALNWMSDAGLVSKADYDDLQAENAVLKERIGSAFADIDDAIAALQKKAADIVYDLGIARTWSWDVPIDEWSKGAKPKRRTDADFRNADIDGNGYVTFRDGGAA